MEENNQEDDLQKALEKEAEARGKINYWAEVIGFSGIILGSIIAFTFNEVFGGLICLGSLVIWMKMKTDSGVS